MPTTLPRTSITQTPRVAALLDIANQHWPTQPAAAQLIHLAELGARTLDVDARAARRAELGRTAATTAAAYGSAYEADYLERLRAEW